MTNKEIERELAFITEQNNIIIKLLYEVLVNQGVTEESLKRWVKKENKKIDKNFNQK